MKTAWVIVGIIVIVLGVGSYFLFIKPAMIRHNCNKGAVKYAVSSGYYSQSQYTQYYNECVEIKGVDKPISTTTPVPVD